MNSYPLETGLSIGAIMGGLFDHKESFVRKAFEKHLIMNEMCEYEVKYVDTAIYRASFHQAAIDIRRENIDENVIDEAKQMDVWPVVAVKYCLRKLGLSTQFYEMDSDDPVHAKLVLPIPEKRRQ